VSPEQSTNKPMSTNTMSEPPSFDPTHYQHPQVKPVSQSPLHSVDNKKSNIVVYRIKECSPRTAKSAHLEQDLQNLASTFDEAKLPINTDSVRDYFRLGKYKSDAQHPRPNLIKFLRPADASLVLLKVSLFKSPVHIKPDLTPEERKIENHQLKRVLVFNSTKL